MQIIVKFGTALDLAADLNLLFGKWVSTFLSAQIAKVIQLLSPTEIREEYEGVSA